MNRSNNRNNKKTIIWIVITVILIILIVGFYVVSSSANKRIAKAKIDRTNIAYAKTLNAKTELTAEAGKIIQIPTETKEPEPTSITLPQVCKDFYDQMTISAIPLDAQGYLLQQKYSVDDNVCSAWVSFGGGDTSGFVILGLNSAGNIYGISYTGVYQDSEERLEAILDWAAVSLAMFDKSINVVEAFNIVPNLFINQKIYVNGSVLAIPSVDKVNLEYRLVVSDTNIPAE